MKKIFIKIYTKLKIICNEFKIIFKKDIDPSTELGRVQKREKAIALTSTTGTISKVIAMLIPFITLRVSRGYLGEEIYGLWSAVNSFFAFFAFADLGLGSGLQTRLSISSGKDNNELEQKRIVSNTFFILFFVSFLLITIFITSYNFVDWASLVGASSTEAISLAAPVFLAIVLPKLLDIPFALTQRTQIALQEGYNFYLWNILGSFLSIISIYLNAYFQSSKIFMIFCSASIPTIIAIINFIYYFCFSKRRIFFPKLKFFSKSTCKTMLTTGIGFLAISILMNIGLSNIDSFIVGKYDSLSTAGNYSICLKTASVVNIVANMFGLPLWGVYGEALSRGDVSYVKKDVFKKSFILLIITITISMIGIFLAPFIFKLLAGSEFKYNQTTLIGMFFLQCSFAAINPFFMVLNGTGNVKSQIIGYGIFAPLSFVFKIFFAKRYGIDVLPWITAICFILILYPIVILKSLKVLNSYQ